MLKKEEGGKRKTFSPCINLCVAELGRWETTTKNDCVKMGGQSKWMIGLKEEEEGCPLHSFPHRPAAKVA
jgi:hypothetical protein